MYAEDDSDENHTASFNAIKRGAYKWPEDVSAFLKNNNNNNIKKSHSLFQCYQAGRLQVARGRVGLRGGTQFTCFPSALLDLLRTKNKK